jgi:subtilisin-like proprotein convertase family protein
MKHFLLFFVGIFLASSLLQNLNSQYYYNRAFNIPGTAGNYVVTDPGANLSITGDFTVECWVRQTVTAGAQIVVQKRLGSAASGYTLYVNGGRVVIRTNGTTRLTGTTVIPLNVWTHIAATYSAATNTFFVYVNGVQDGTVVVAAAAPAADTDSLRIGAGFNSPFNGMIDDVRIWNVERPAAEILSKMRLPLGESGAQYPGLVGSWRANNPAGGSGTEDINGYTAYLRGTASYVLTGNNPGGYTAYNTGVILSGAAGSYISSGHAANLNITGSFTLECWCNPVNSTTPAFQNIIAKRLSGSNGYELYLNAGRVTARTNGSTRLSGTTVLTNNVWSHVAVTYDAATTTFKTYVNGVSDGTIVTAGTPVTNTDSLYFGRGINSPFAGMLDEMRVTNYAKTEEEIQKMMYTSIDANNEPVPSTNTNITYSFEGTLDGTDGALRGGFRGTLGTSRFTLVYNSSSETPAPNSRDDAGFFGNGYRFRSPGLNFGSSPSTILDSIFIPQGLTINDVNVFVGITHAYTNDISLSIRNPAGTTTRVLYASGSPDNGKHMITIFDDQADSTANENLRAPWSPKVKPANALSIFNGQNSLGYWRLSVTDVFTSSDDGRLIGWGIQFNNSAITSTGNEVSTVPVRFNLHQNYPNPFNPTTSIKYDISMDAFVKITVFDVLGREVQTLINEQKKAGSYSVMVNFSGLASGIYFYTIKAGDFTDTKKMILIK